MNNTQRTTINIFVILLIALYFGFDTKPSNHGLIEKSRALKMSATDVSILKKEAQNTLSDTQKGRIDLLNAQLNSTSDTLLNIQYKKELSGAWYQFGFPSIAGSYAEEIAIVENSDEAWGIAATTYAMGIGDAKSIKESKFCKEKALQAFDMAISIDGNELRHQLNKAVTLAEHADEDNPMKGILQLLDLNKAHPENVAIINQLAKLGMKTNQLEKALERLKKALSLQPDNVTSICLMAEVLTRKNEIIQAEKYITKCNNLTNK
ncbi:MAG: hypothetical protein V3V00_11760 [Saprospiraceae bacterium]